MYHKKSNTDDQAGRKYMSTTNSSKYLKYLIRELASGRDNNSSQPTLWAPSILFQKFQHLYNNINFRLKTIKQINSSTCKCYNKSYSIKLLARYKQAFSLIQFLQQLKHRFPGVHLGLKLVEFLSSMKNQIL